MPARKPQEPRDHQAWMQINGGVHCHHSKNIQRTSEKPLQPELEKSNTNNTYNISVGLNNFRPVAFDKGLGVRPSGPGEVLRRKFEARQIGRHSQLSLLQTTGIENPIYCLRSAFQTDKADAGLPIDSTNKNQPPQPCHSLSRREKYMPWLHLSLMKSCSIPAELFIDGSFIESRRLHTRQSLVNADAWH